MTMGRTSAGLEAMLVASTRETLMVNSPTSACEKRADWGRGVGSVTS